MKEILEYQKLDIELNKLKNSNVNSVERNNMAKLKSYIVEAHDQGMRIENDAKTLMDDYTKLKKQYETNLNKVQKLTATDISNIKAEDVDGVLSNINALSNELFLLERNINIIITKIRQSLKDFDVAKNNIIKAKQKYNIFKTKYEQDLKTSMPKVKELEDRMKEMESKISPELLSKYRSVKADKIFPVFVPFNNGHCAGCRVEIPTSRVNKLKADKMIICEQCHRVIYLPNAE